MNDLVVSTAPGASVASPGLPLPWGCVGERVLPVAPGGLGICYSDAGLGALAGQVYPALPAPASARHRLCLRRLAGVCSLERVDGSRTEVPDDDQEILVRLEREVVAHARRRRPDELFLHAAGAVGRAGAVVVFGASGAGKSSVALALLRRGLPLLADDMLPLDAAGRAAPFPRHLKVAPDRLAGSGVDPRATPGYAPGVPEVWLDPAGLAPGFAPRPAPIAVGAQVAYAPGAPSLRVRRLPGPRLLLVALRSRFPSDDPPHRVVDRLLPAVEDVPGYHLTFSDSGAAADFLADVVGGA
jgi:hypothetical protein